MYVYQSKDPNSLIDRSCSLSRSGSQVVEGADVAKWIKAMDCGSITRGFNPRRSPIQLDNSFLLLGIDKFLRKKKKKVDRVRTGILNNNDLKFPIQFQFWTRIWIEITILF